MEHKHKQRHLLLMALCCLIPIALIGTLLYARVEGRYLYFLLILLCPLMYFLMMMSGRRGH